MPTALEVKGALAVLSACVVGYALAAATWPLRKQSPGVRLTVLIPLCLAFAATPFLFTWIPPQIRTGMAIVLGCVFPCKLLDAHLTAETWRTLPFTEWLKFLIHPTVLVRRLHLLEPPRTSLDNVKTLAEGILTVLSGQMLIPIVIWSGVARHSFWVEHFCIAIVLYLTVFHGGNVVATGFLRCIGSNVTDLSRHPIVSVTPSDFWRRYNRSAGQFFAEDVFKVIGGLRRPVPAIFGTFIANGILHEYIMTASSGRLTGYMMAFFVLQAVGVAASFRIRPRSPLEKAIGIAATFTFNYLTTIFFFAAIHGVFCLYRYHTLLP